MLDRSRRIPASSAPWTHVCSFQGGRGGSPPSPPCRYSKKLFSYLVPGRRLQRRDGGEARAADRVRDVLRVRARDGSRFHAARGLERPRERAARRERFARRAVRIAFGDFQQTLQPFGAAKRVGALEERERGLRIEDRA